MRILRQGDNGYEFARQKCGNCYSLLEIGIRDCHNDRPEQFEFKCPVCGTFQNVRKVPPSWR